MKNLKHTKGEWEVYKNSCFFEVSCRSEGNPSMDVNIFLQDGKTDKNLSKENEANAKLIASAPELLEALEHCRNGLEATHFEAAKPFIDLADNAIKKATGEV